MVAQINDNPISVEMYRCKSLLAVVNYLAWDVFPRFRLDELSEHSPIGPYT